MINRFDFIDGEQPALIGRVERDVLSSLELLEESQGTGNIYRGRVTNMVEGMNCCFVNIGQSQNAYLPFKFMKQSENQKVKQGDTVLVQVKREAKGEKGAVITMDISLKGRYLVLLPMSRQIKISNKIQDKQTRDELYHWAKSLNYKGGMILRTAAVNTDSATLHAEFKSLFQESVTLDRERHYLPTPKLIYSEDSFNKYFLDRKEKLPVITNSKVYEKRLHSLGIEKVIYDESFSILGEPIYRRQYDEMFLKQIPLKSGGNFVIEAFEALTVIDVNSGQYTKASNLKDLKWELNLEAAQKICQQIKLRQLGGMFVIDFIHMEDEKLNYKLKTVIEEFFRKDPLTTVIYGFSPMGLFEMSRERQSLPLPERINKLKTKS